MLLLLRAVDMMFHASAGLLMGIVGFFSGLADTMWDMIVNAVGAFII